MKSKFLVAERVYPALASLLLYGFVILVYFLLTDVVEAIMAVPLALFSLSRVIFLLLVIFTILSLTLYPLVVYLSYSLKTKERKRNLSISALVFSPVFLVSIMFITDIRVILSAVLGLMAISIYEFLKLKIFDYVKFGFLGGLISNIIFISGVLIFSLSEGKTQNISWGIYFFSIFLWWINLIISPIATGLVLVFLTRLGWKKGKIVEISNIIFSIPLSVVTLLLILIFL